MKRLLALSMALVMLLVCLTSCGLKFDDYEKNLDDAKYEVETLKKSKIKALLEEIDLDKDDFPVENALYAYKNSKYIYVFEFESSGVAEDFMGEIEDMEDEFDDIVSHA